MKTGKHTMGDKPRFAVTKFTWREWLHAGANENLFLLDEFEAKVFKLLVKESLKA
jgi:hypothetical protein